VFRTEIVHRLRASSARTSSAGEVNSSPNTLAMKAPTGTRPIPSGMHPGSRSWSGLRMSRSGCH
jgi:hypothetical protein